MLNVCLAANSADERASWKLLEVESFPKIYANVHTIRVDQTNGIGTINLLGDNQSLFYLSPTSTTISANTTERSVIQKYFYNSPSYGTRYDHQLELKGTVLDVTRNPTWLCNPRDEIRRIYACKLGNQCRSADDPGRNKV